MIFLSFLASLNMVGELFQTFYLKCGKAGKSLNLWIVIRDVFTSRSNTHGPGMTHDVITQGAHQIAASLHPNTDRSYPHASRKSHKFSTLLAL